MLDRMIIYNNIPIWAQNMACYLEGRKISKFRFGKLFWSKLEEYEKRDKWSYEQICEYRDHKLNYMVRYCYKNVPYYHELFDEYGINPDSIKRLDDMKTIPILTKDIVNKNPECFYSKSFSMKNMVTAHTSGTTGAGFVFKTTQEAICDQWAVWWRYRRRLGIKYGTLSGNFGTRFVVPAKQSKPPFWRYNLPCNQIYFSAFHEKADYLKYYIQEIEEKHITWLHGYPSLLCELASEVLNEGNTVLKEQIQYVTIGAESLLDYQKNIIEKAFGVHVFQHYGMSEGVTNISETKEKLMLVDEDYAATEFIDYGENKKIVGTSLTNFAMPLLRWDTNDIAQVEEVDTLGRIVKSIDGRIEDYVVLPSGKKIGKLHHVFKDAVHLKEVQIYQDKDYKIKVLFVPREDKYENDIVVAQEMFNYTFGEHINIEFVRVDCIKKTKSGKIRFIISEIK